ncbi:MAG TPA: phenylalanine--tRNA ligase beta subunit-related protein [Paludibacter sp.]|nr:phenylalanine--tRNA ligase beta subunit-related protein [Paludibacter sp.]
MNIEISNKIKQACPHLALAIIICEVQNSETSAELWSELGNEVQYFTETHTLEDINKRPAIAATRNIYKSLGKDPNRYRPSAEALCRRIIRGIPIYRVSTLVDIINLVSIRSGFSIGGFDANLIQGDVKLDAGTANDDFEAIGRGKLNVEGLPLYKDEVGGIGTPTSDNERTKLSPDTTQLLVVINGYSGENELMEAANHTIQLLEKYAALGKYEVSILK